MSTPFFVAGRPETGEDVTGGDVITVRHPYDGREVGRTSNASPDQVERAVAAAARAPRDLPIHVRATALDQVSRVLAGREDGVAGLHRAENGKPLKGARAGAARAVSTFRWAAEEARRFSGELQRLDTAPAAEGRIAVVHRRIRGPILGISPFNSPLTLVAHKLAPAIAVGAPIVVKPAPATPLSALLLGELLAATDLPSEMYSILPIPNDRAPALVADPRLPVVSFTGSGPVGWQIRDAVPRKHVTLELGGNAAVLVCADWADLAWAADRIATFANYQAGQSCIAVQRVYAHVSRYDALVDRVVRAVGALRVGDPGDESTDVGPLISEDAAKRVEAWVDEAVAAGARVLTGGVRTGTSYAPTVLGDAPAGAKGLADEGFGPGLALAPVESDEAGLAAINDSACGLQAGVFTRY